MYPTRPASTNCSGTLLASRSTWRLLGATPSSRFARTQLPLECSARWSSTSNARSKSACSRMPKPCYTIARQRCAPKRDIRGRLPLHYEINFGNRWNVPRLLGAAQEELDALAAVRAKVDCPLVHVHADKCVGGLLLHATRIAQRPLECFAAVSKTVLDALTQMPGGLRFDVVWQRAANCVDAKR